MKKSICVLMALVSLGMAGCGGPRRFQYFSTHTLNYFDKNLSNYKGQVVAFRGRVIDAEEKGGICLFQIITEDYAGHYGGELLTVIFQQHKTEIVKNNRIIVLGRIGDNLEGKNVFGMNVSSITLTALSILSLKYSHGFNELFPDIVYTVKNPTKREKKYIEKWQEGKFRPGYKEQTKMFFYK